MAERMNIGEILQESGRISEKDIAAAVQYQQDHGGYFGEALVALGLLSPDVLEWGLASQFDLPYVFPDADSVDPNAASLVTPEWALAHLTLPILATSNTLTVVTDSPLKTEAIDDLRALTEREIQLALASPSKIRELIRQVFARAAAQESQGPAATARLQEVFHLAFRGGASRFGVSARGRRAWAWYDDGGRITRRPLTEGWEQELQELVDPPPDPSMALEGRGRVWRAQIRRDERVQPVEVRYLGSEKGVEYLFRPAHEPSSPAERLEPPPLGILSEIRLLARYGSARFIVTSEPESLGRQILPRLPALLFEPSMRCVHVTDSEGGGADLEDSISIELPRDQRDRWLEEFEALRPFHFDVVTVDLFGERDGQDERDEQDERERVAAEENGSGREDGGSAVAAAEWVQPALDIASVVLFLWPAGAGRSVPFEAGIRWELHLRESDDDAIGGAVEWSLAPFRA